MTASCFRCWFQLCMQIWQRLIAKYRICHAFDSWAVKFHHEMLGFHICHLISANPSTTYWDRHAAIRCASARYTSQMNDRIESYVTKSMAILHTFTAFEHNVNNLKNIAYPHGWAKPGRANAIAVKLWNSEAICLRSTALKIKWRRKMNDHFSWWVMCCWL